MQRAGAGIEPSCTSVLQEVDDVLHAPPEKLPENPTAVPVKIRKVQFVGGSESFAEVSDALSLVDDNLVLQHMMSFWEKMVASRPTSDPRSMLHPRAMRHVIIGDSDGMVNFCMINEEKDQDDSAVDVTMQATCDGVGHQLLCRHAQQGGL